jgi:hypothetical protein
MSKATRGRGAVIGLEAWLGQVVVERVKGIDEELVKRSCVGSAEWSVVQELSFTKGHEQHLACLACCSHPHGGSLQHRLPLEWATNDLSRHDEG